MTGLQKSSHRLDVQALRGLAVLLVVVFHAGAGLSGGFIGVDIFFVISGFVIAGSLQREHSATGSVGLGSFYRRRVRRLLPALSLVTTTTLIASVVAAGAALHDVIGRTGAAASLFSANLFLASTGVGYFDPTEEVNPLLHTWSLSIEEQFYFFLPASFVVAAIVARKTDRRFRPVLATGLGLILLASLLLSLGVSYGVLPLGSLPATARIAFYMPFTRSWEFLAGVLLALGSRAAPRSERQLVSVAGLAGVVVAAIVLSQETTFPGIAAVVPVVGTVAMIHGGSAWNAETGYVWRVLRWLGDRSYSWYLWHWPTIVLAAQVWPTTPGVKPMAAIVSLVPANLTYHFVEERFRQASARSAASTLRIAAVCIAVPVAVSIALVNFGGTRHVDVSPDWTETTKARAAGCHSVYDVLPWPVDLCTWKADNARGTLLLLGDSHAASLSDAVTDAARANGFDVMVWTRAGCPFNLNFDSTTSCNSWQREASALARTIEPDVIVVANRSTAYVSGYQNGGFPPEAVSSDSWAGGAEAASDLADELGAQLVIVLPVPDYEVNGPQLASLIRPEGYLVTQPVQEALERRAPAVEVATRLAAETRTRVFDPLPSLCNDICSPMIEDRWAYYDDHHLSVFGASLLTDGLTELLARIETERRIGG